MQRSDSTLQVNTQITGGEAFYMLQGSPQKVGKTAEVKMKASGFSSDALLQFELRFDSLKTYLDGFSTVINQHAAMLNQIQVDITNRVMDSNLHEILEKLGLSSVIKEKELGFILSNLSGKLRPENTGKKEDDSVNGFSNKLELFSHGFSHFHKTNVDFTGKFEKTGAHLNKIDSDLNQKVSQADMKAKVKKTKKKLRSHIDDNCKDLNAKIKALEAKFDEAVHGLDRKIDETEKKTNFRIKDCEDLLKTRINEEYVDDSVRQLEERLMKEIEKQGLSNSESLQLSIKELTHKVKKCEDSIDDKVSSLKKNIKEIETNISRRLESTRFEEFRKEILARLDSESEKVKIISKKYDTPIDNLTGEVNQIKIQLKNLTDDVKTIPRDFPEPAAPIINNTGLGQEELDSAFSKYRVDLAKLKETVRVIEEQVTTKVDSTFFSLQLSKKLDVSEFERVMGDQDKLKRLLLMQEDLTNKINGFEELIDRKINKLKKEIGLNDLLKKLQGKAEEDNVVKGFENTDKKINALSDNLLALKKQLDQAFSALEKVSVQMFSFDSNASLSTKKINPLACLSCGHFSKTHSPLHSVMGTDGKYYRADNDAYEMGGIAGKTLSPGNNLEKSINITYTYASNAGVKEKIRPSTATNRNRTQNKNTVSSATLPNSAETLLLRPTSAKNRS